MYNTIRRFAILLMISAVPSATAAQNKRPDLSSLSLEELLNIPVVTVSRMREGAAEAPARVEVVTAGQIRRRGYRSLAELLKDLPGIKMDWAIDQDLSGDVTVQGTRGGSRLVILLDGVRISSPTNEGLPILANYPVHNARQVEIVYGPASALYGADAFSGVINILSRDADEAEGLRAATSYGQDGLVNTEASYGVRLGNGARMMVAGQFFYDRQPDLTRSYPEQFGDLESHRSGTFNTIFGPMTAGVPVSPEFKVPVRAHSFHTTLHAGPLQASLFQSMVRTSNTPAYTPDNAVYNDIAFAQNELLVGAVSYHAKIGRANTTTTLSASRHELDPQSGYMNVYSNMQHSFKYAYGSMLRAEHQASWKVAQDISLAAGGSIERLFSIPQSADLNAPITKRGQAGTILGTDIIDEPFLLRYSNVGSYVQGQWQVDRRWTLTAGLRGDANSRYETVFNPRLGLVSRVTKDTTLKLLYGTAFLAPSPYQSYSHYGSFYTVDGGATYQSDFWHVPNPDLKPQRKRTVEMQLQQSLGAKVSLAASGFYSRFTGLVLESDVTARDSGQYLGWPVAFIQSSVNAGRETTYGGTVSADFLNVFAVHRQLRVRGAISIAEGREMESQAPGGRVESGGIAPVLFHLLADIDWNRWTFAPRLVAAGEQRAIAIDTSGRGAWKRHAIDGYATVDLTVRRERVAGPMDLFVRVDNLLDARYRHLNLRAFSNPEEMEGSPQNPRRITVGLQLRFE